MKIITRSFQLLLLVGISSTVISCAQKDDPTPEPVKEPVRQKAAPAPVVSTPTENPFRDPSGNMSLPTDAQLNEGRDSSIGTGSQPPLSNPDNAPSVAVTPPSTSSAPTISVPATPKKPLKKEDQLDPQ